MVEINSEFFDELRYHIIFGVDGLEISCEINHREKYCKFINLLIFRLECKYN